MSKSKKLKSIIITLFGIAIIMALAYVFAFIIFGKPDEINYWAGFGAYFSSITGLLAFAGVLYSASLSDERTERAELEYKKNEDREFFFKSIELLKNNIENYIKINRSTIEDPFKAESQKFSEFTFFYYIMNFFDKIDTNKFYKFIDDLGSSEKEILFLKYIISVNNIPYFEDDSKYSQVKTKDQIVFDQFIKYRHRSKGLCDLLYKHSIDLDSWTEVLYNKIGLELSSEDIYKILQKANSIYFYKSSYQLKLFCNTYHYITEYLYTSNLDKYKCLKILESQITNDQLIILYAYLFKDTKNIEYIKIFEENNVFDMIGRSGLFIYNSIYFYDDDTMKKYNKEHFDKLIRLSQTTNPWDNNE